MKKTFILTLLVLASTSFAGEQVSPTLKSVMQDLGKSMDLLNKGIFYEDFTLIEEAASKIAHHPKPKSQLPIVVQTLNTRMPVFKKFDGKVHGSAADIVNLAKERNMASILDKQSVIINNCVACHTQFRSEISQALSQ